MEHQNSSILISIIIPAYNCEKYINDCLQSILHQNLSAESYEIIVINDGSTDNTLSILEEIQDKNDNIRIYTQKNKGRHVARNIGAEMSRGKYIWFIDNDDIICHNCLKDIADTAEKLNLDVLAVAPPLPFRENFPRDFLLQDHVSNVMSGKDFLLNKACYWAPWEFVIKRDFYQRYNFTFKLRYFLEDIELLFRVFYFTGRIAEFTQFSCYSYIKRPESETMNPWTVNKVMDFARYINLVDEFITENNIEDSYKHKFEILRTQFYINALNNWKNIKDKMPLSAILQEIKNRPKTTYGKSLFAKIYQKIAIHLPYIFVYLK